MHFYTKNAQFSSDDKMLVKANAMVRYASAAQEKTGHLDFNLGWKKFASLTNITFSDFGDLMSGSTKLTGYTNTWDRTYFQERINKYVEEECLKQCAIYFSEEEMNALWL